MDAKRNIKISVILRFWIDINYCVVFEKEENAHQTSVSSIRHVFPFFSLFTTTLIRLVLLNICYVYLRERKKNPPNYDGLVY